MIEKPKWLYDICWGLADNHRFRILLESERYAIVQIPGGDFANGQVRQYGTTTYYKVDKQATTLRAGVGLIDSEKIQDGGRAKLTQWRKLI